MQQQQSSVSSYLHCDSWNGFLPFNRTEYIRLLAVWVTMQARVWILSDQRALLDTVAAPSWAGQLWLLTLLLLLALPSTWPLHHSSSLHLSLCLTLSCAGTHGSCLTPASRSEPGQRPTVPPLTCLQTQTAGIHLRGQKHSARTGACSCCAPWLQAADPGHVWCF